MTVTLERRFANFRRVAEAASALAPSPPARSATRVNAERLAAAVDGELVATPRGSFVRVTAPTTLLPVDRSRLARLPGQPPPDAPLLCLDTETTGLATAAGTLAFLVGLGWWDGSLFRQEQLLLPDHADEPALLDELAMRIPPGGWLVTYNGRGFDWPLLVARFRMAGASPPRHAGHLDLLPVVRRVFRHRMPDARLASVESELLGLRRGADVAGWEIPGRYLEFLRDGEPGRLVDVLRHNDEDVRSLARLLVHLDRDYADGERWREAPPGDLAGLARAFSRDRRDEEALACLDVALAALAAGAPAAGPSIPSMAAPAAAIGAAAAWARPGMVRRRPLPEDEPWWSPRRRPDFGGRPDRYAGPDRWAAAQPERRDAPWTEPRMRAERARLLRRLRRYREAEAAWAVLAQSGGLVGALAWIEVAKLREHRLGEPERALEAAIAAERLIERQAWLGRPMPQLSISVAARLRRLRRRLAGQLRPSRSSTAARSGTPASPSLSTDKEAAVAATRISPSTPGSIPNASGLSRAATIAPRNTSPAPVASTARSAGNDG
jgi:hypothetical protein